MKKNRFGMALGAPMAFAAASMAPVAVQAQESEPVAEQMAELGAKFATMFIAEPLTPEQQARLPLASEVVAKVMPEGFYAEMMDQTLGSMVEPMRAVMPRTMLPAELATYLGQPRESLETLDEDQLVALSVALDPAYAERMDAGMAFMMSELVDRMAALEPYMRDGVSRGYAVRFTRAQLEDIAAFFATETGAVYASESMMVFTDPQVMSASMQAMPLLLEDMPQIMGEVQQIIDASGQRRSFAQLSAEQRNMIAGALGIGVGDLQQGMKEADMLREGPAEE